MWENRRRRDFERMMLPAMPAAYRLAYAIVRSAEDAADVVQEAYLRAWAGFAHYRGEGAAPWLLAVVRNTALQSLRKRTRRANVISFEQVDASEIVDCDPSPELAAAEQEELRRTQRALDALPTAYREILLLREIEGFSYQEIAGVVGVPIGTVMSRLHRARVQLRATLADRKALGARE